MEDGKICFKCNEFKSLSDYYSHPRMRDGHLNKCKSCTKKGVASRIKVLSADQEWIDSERARGREKYKRLGYNQKHNRNSQYKLISTRNYRDKYPEKNLAHAAVRRDKNITRTMHESHFHHWSYSKECRKDVIELSKTDHAFIHRFLVYDRDLKVYRRGDNNSPLSTRMDHENYIFSLLKQQPTT